MNPIEKRVYLKIKEKNGIPLDCLKTRFKTVTCRDMKKIVSKLVGTKLVYVEIRNRRLFYKARPQFETYREKIGGKDHEK